MFQQTVKGIQKSFWERALQVVGMASAKALRQVSSENRKEARVKVSQVVPEKAMAPHSSVLA